MRISGWPPRGRSADAVLALTLLPFVFATTVWAGEEGGAPSLVPGPGWIVFVVVACGALYWRRSRPVTVGVLELLVCGSYYSLTEPDGPIMVAFIVALYTVAAEGRPAVAALLAGGAMALVAYGEVRSGVNHLQDAALYLMAGWFVAVVAVGGVVRNRRAYLREAEERALAAEHGREEEARRRAIEERLRIARELHDLLGHNISLINVQANAALHGSRGEPGPAEEALAAIKQVSKDTLRELRATLGMLRQVDEETPAASPPPGLARLEELTGRAAAVGPAVRTEIEGEPRPLPPETDLAAYRIVQEALTNVTRHSDATSVIVRIRYGDDEVRVEIGDDGRSTGAATPGTGSGIRGMRERAEALGGELTAAAAPGGGFRVSARLPIPDSRSFPVP